MINTMENTEAKPVKGLKNYTVLYKLLIQWEINTVTQLFYTREGTMLCEWLPRQQIWTVKILDTIVYTNSNNVK